MRERTKRTLGILAVALLLQAPASAQLGKRKGGVGGRKATVDMLAATDAIVPGETLQLGVRFAVKDRWHIYWQNSGDSGMPPRVKWDLPSGFSAGEFAFPVPKRHEAAGGMIVTNILEGNPVLLVDVTTPATIEATEVRLKAHVQYLICEETCIREESDIALTLPVRPAGAQPANERVFAAARNSLPKPKSTFVKVSASVGEPPPKPGDDFSLTVQLDVADGHSVLSNATQHKSLVGFELFVARVPDVYWDKPEFPEAKTRSVPAYGTLSEFSGPVRIRVPGEVDAEATGPFPFGGVVVFQACDDDGKCFPAEAVQFAMGDGGDKSRVGAAGPTVPAKTPGGVLADSGPSDAPADTADLGTGDALEDFFRRLGLPGLLLGCFLYGLIINATPCVLPLLSIKVLGFVQQAHESRSRTLMLGLSFGAGVMIFFVALGLLAAQGTNVLQFPAAVIALGAVVLALALSMLGVYTLQVPTAATNLDASIQKEGMLASFGKGALAPVLGFACTGPLLAGAFGWATQQPPQIAIIAFLVTGLGMASPYMLLGANPNWLGFLPKPGQWMITFERLMGFLLLGMVVWLLHPLIYQIGPQGLEWTLGFLVFVGMACWVWGKINATMPKEQQWRLRGVAAAIVVISGGMVYGWVYPIGPAIERTARARLAGEGAPKDWADGVPWRTWSPEAVAETVRAGKAVFVDVTAAQCTQCKVNKLVATNTEEVRAKMQQLGVVPFQADYTFPDSTILEELRRFERPGPPMNLIYAPGKLDKPVLLRPALTQDYLLEKLDEVIAS